MEQVLSRIPVVFSDQDINALLKSVKPGKSTYSRHFTQSEDFMLRLPVRIDVGSCPIHHDVQHSRPSAVYLSFLRKVVEQLAVTLPDVFGGLTHIFDPSDIFRPAFIKLYRFENQDYLYQIRLDLHVHPQEDELVERGDNDRTAAFKTDSLILEADFIPLDGVDTRDGKIHGFLIEQSVSETWIGESGRGYFVQGIWLDRDLTRFFSKVFAPEGARLYPYFPFNCKYRAICHAVISLDAEARQKSLPYLHKARAFLLPHLREIEDSLRDDTGQLEKNPTYVRMKEAAKAPWTDVLARFSARAYLNSHDRKEYEVESALV